ncbi:MAG: hypothetical protein KUG80_04805 [Gammaproteobacteria bacterium]|nr:hypothetical protein [Gammaproteobacteria bacterium]
MRYILKKPKYHGSLITAALLLSIFISTILRAEEFSHVEPSANGQRYHSYLNSLGTPSVQIKNKCAKNGSPCWATIVNQDNRELKHFGSDDSVASLASGRYEEIAYQLVSHSYSCGDKRCTKNLLFSNYGKVKNTGILSWLNGSLATRIGRNRQIYAVMKNGMITLPYEGEASTLAAPEPLLSARIGFNIVGDISTIAVAKSGALYWSNGKKWKMLSTKLAPHGDRMNVASIFPKDHDTHYIALYHYTNEYNKGVYAIRFNSSTNLEEGGWIFNSEDRNIGFNPDIYGKQGNNIVIATKNSTDKNDAFYTLQHSEFRKLDSLCPPHVCANGFSNEKTASIMLGTSLSQLSWLATSKVKKNDTTYTDIDYLISDSLFKSVNAEGRIGDIKLTVQYLQNESENHLSNEIHQNGNSNTEKLSKSASSYLFSTIDFLSLLSPSSALRIQVGKSETNGIAKISQRDTSVRYQNFTTEITNFAVLNMKEKGHYMGVDYTNYLMPSAIGFSNTSRSIVYSNFDSKFGFQTLRLIMGYDAFAYAKRYETNYNRFYWSGSGNVGLGLAKISSYIEQDALATTSATSIDKLPLYVTLGIDFESGYLYQRRYKKMKGFGYSFGLGYRGSYSLMSAGQSDESKPKAKTLYMEFERNDFMHGPFLKYNVIF